MFFVSGIPPEPNLPELKMVNGVGTSSDLNWLITRNTSCYLMKARGVSKHFSKDPLNPKGLYKPRFQGAIQSRALSVQEHPSGKGVVMLAKKKRNQRKPAQASISVPLTRGAGRTTRSIKQFVNKSQYRKDLKNVSVPAICLSFFWNKSYSNLLFPSSLRLLSDVLALCFVGSASRPRRSLLNRRRTRATFFLDSLVSR